MEGEKRYRERCLLIEVEEEGDSLASPDQEKNSGTTDPVIDGSGLEHGELVDTDNDVSGPPHKVVQLVIWSYSSIETDWRNWWWAYGTEVEKGAPEMEFLPYVIDKGGALHRLFWLFFIVFLFLWKLCRRLALMNSKCVGRKMEQSCLHSDELIIGKNEFAEFGRKKINEKEPKRFPDGPIPIFSKADYYWYITWIEVLGALEERSIPIALRMDRQCDRKEGAFD